MPEYYTYKKDADAAARPGQTVKFTAGKGYYISGTATAPKQVSDAASAGGYTSTPTKTTTATPAAKQPTAAVVPPTQTSDAASGGGYGPTPLPKQPTAPTLAPGTTTSTPVDRPSPTSSAPAPSEQSDAASSGGYGSRYYTYKAQAQAALRPGQKMGFTRGRGYYDYYPSAAAPSPPSIPRLPPTGPTIPKEPTTPKRPTTPTTPTGPTTPTVPTAPTDPGGTDPGRSLESSPSNVGDLSVPLSKLVYDAQHPPKLTPDLEQLVKRLENVSIHTPKGTFAIVNPYLTVLAAAIAGISITLACAILVQESSGGHNVWGDDSDHGQNFQQGYDARTGRHYGPVVTQDSYDAYAKQRNPNNLQGVGPTQLTSLDLQQAADKAGGAWKPLPNLLIGFARAAWLVDNQPLNLALAAYNGSPAYAGPVQTYERLWAGALGVPSVQG
jgi:hypothetical protein